MRFRTQEEVEDILKAVREKVEQYVYPDDFAAIYQAEHSYPSSVYSVPAKETIAKWLEKHDGQYFAETLEERRPYEAEDRRSALWAFSGVTRTVTKYRWEVTDFELTAHCSYDVIQIAAKPKYPNIPQSAFILVLILSKTSIRFFYCFSDYREKNWKERELPHRIEWRTAEILLQNRDEIIEFVSTRQSEYVSWIMKRVKDKFSVREEK